MEILGFFNIKLDLRYARKEGWETYTRTSVCFRSARFGFDAEKVLLGSVSRCDLGGGDIRDLLIGGNRTGGDLRL